MSVRARALAEPIPGVMEPTVMIRTEERDRTGSTGNGIKVLLVEDNPGDVGLMRANLEDSHYHGVMMLHADRLQKAVDMVMTHHPDVILLDLGLPDSSGLDTLDGMVKAAGPIPIVVLTGYSDENLGMEAVSRGAQDYLVKGEVDSASLGRSLRYSIHRRRALEELRESNQRYHSLFNDNHAAMIMIDPVNGSIVDVNEAAVDFYGYPREMLTTLNIVDLVSLESSEVFEMLGKAASKDQQHIFLKSRLSDGTVREVEVFSGPINIRGRVILYAIVHDITERKRAEEARERLTMELAQQHDLLQTVIDNSPFGIMVLTGPELVVKLSNNAAVDMMKADASAIVGRSISEAPVMRRGGHAHIQELVDKARQSGEPVIVKELDVSEMVGGEPTFWQAAVIPLPDPFGDQDVLVMFQNMTDQVLGKRQIEELANRADSERRRLRTILDNLPVGVIVADWKGNVQERNDIMDVIWGGRTTHSRAMGERGGYKGWWADTGMTVRAEEWPLARAMKTGESVVGEVIDIQRLDGTRGTIISSASPIRDADGKTIGGVEVVQDITRQRKLEHDAIEAKEQAELYIDLLSHDISNMNAAIRGYLELALEKMDIEEKNKQYFTKPIDIIETSNRLIENVRKIQQVEGHDAKHGMIDLGWLLEDVRSEAESYPGREVKINYKTTIKKFVIASELLRDVFENIITNAIKHSTGPVEISISLTKMFENGWEYYKVAIEDDGPGIPDEVKTRLFQRKQRGRSKTAGTGLGLFLVKKLVEDFNGRVWVEDRVPGDHTQGANFVVMLPAVTADGRGQVNL